MKKQIFKYHGGKHTIKKWVVSHFPSDINKLSYIEPFMGSGSVFFELYSQGLICNRKQTVINDLDDNVINFYRVLREQPEKIQDQLQKTIYARQEYYNCWEKLKNSSNLSSLEQARCFYVVQISSFMGMGMGASRAGFATEKTKNACAKKLYSGAENLHDFAEVFKKVGVSIENLKAVDLIKKYDFKDAFFYLDPPYVNTICKYKDKYTIDNFRELVDLLDNIKGRFAMSNFPQILNLCPKLKKYQIVKRQQPRFVHGKEIKRTEILIMNYQKKELKEAQTSFEF